MKTNILILLLCLSACVAVGGLFLRDTGNKASGRLKGGSRRATPGSHELDDLPGPLIQTNSPYLNGRGHWFSEHFNGLFMDALGLEPLRALDPRVVIHRQPFSNGPWLKVLDEHEAKARTTTESQTVEAHLVIELAGVSSEHLLQFLIFSGYQKKIEGIGRLERELFFSPFASPLPELGHDFVIEPHQFICRERTQRPEFLAQPTACYYLFDARRFGDAYLLRYDLLANSRRAGLSAGLSGKVPATIHLSAGQFVITPSDAGARLHHVGFYSGQSMPAVFDEFVKNHTVDFFQKMGKTIRSLAPSWEASPEAREWAETALR